MATPRKTFRKTKKNAVVLQSGGPTAVINNSLVGVAQAWEELSDGALFGALYGINGLINNWLVKIYPCADFRKFYNVGDSPSAALASSRHNLKNKFGEVKEEEVRKIFHLFKERQIGFVFLIGGEDSRENAYVLSEHATEHCYNIAVNHIPKTIDNDLTLNHHSPGYLSAARCIINFVAELDRDNASIPGVMIDVVMGRKTGWLAAAASVARNCAVSTFHQEGHFTARSFAEKNAGPHLIYLPEIEFGIEKFLADISATMQKYGRAHIVVAEGIAEQQEIKDYIEKIGGTEFFSELCDVDDFGHPQLSGTGILGALLSHMVKKGLKIKRVRANTFDYLQRCSARNVSEVDAEEARIAGQHAVQCAIKGLKHMTVTVGEDENLHHYSGRIGHVKLEIAFQKGKPRIKFFPTQLVIDGNNISENFEYYLGVKNCANNDRCPIEVPTFRVLDFDEVV